MSNYPIPRDLNQEQAETLEKAALLIINARSEAASMLARSGVELPPEPGFFGNPCTVLLPPPPQNHACGCNNYTGDGGPCRTRFTDFTGPDFGSGSPTRTCQHRASEHIST